MSGSSLSKSATLFERALKVLPSGVSRNTLLRGSNPLYVERAKGCKIVDIDGVERIDFANNMAAHIHGHSFEPIVSAVSEQLQKGTAFTMATEVEVLFAEHMCSRSESFDQIRFVNSGTEAVMTGMKASRAFTGRTKIAKVEGSYHGAYDYAEVSQAPSPKNWGESGRPNSVPLAHGTPESVVQDMIVLPFNDIEKTLLLLEEQKEDLACVLIDPVPHRLGMIPVNRDYVHAIRDWTTKNGSLLMFDEVITYRNEVGGMQQRLDVLPDLTSMGKLIGGGFPVGALAGRRDVMAVFVKGEQGLLLPHSGTFSANPITMTAGLVAMQHYDRETVAKLNKLGDYTRCSLADAIKQADVPASVTGAGSLFRIHLKEKAPENYRDNHLNPKESQALSDLIDHLYDKGIVMIHTAGGTLSTAMGESEIDQLSEAVYQSMCLIRGLLQ